MFIQSRVHDSQRVSLRLRPIVAALAATGLSSLTATAFAATFTVNNNADSGAGSLRQAVADANSSAGADTIAFAAGLGTITLISDIFVSDVGGAALTINGNGVANTVISGGGTVRIFDAYTSLSLNSLTLTNGFASNSTGGAIRAEASNGTTSTLSLNDVLVSNSRASGNGSYGGGGVGGAISADVGGYGGSLSLNVSNATFDGNSASYGGGGIYVGELDYGGSVTISRSVFRNNSTGGYGGGAIALVSTGDYGGTGTISLDQLVLVDNAAYGGSYGGGGGAIALTDAEAGGGTSITRSFFSGNTASNGGGALIVTGPDVDVLVRNNTFVGNTSYGGNSSNGGGGGAVRIDPQDETVNFDHNTVVSNTGYGGSSALHITASSGGGLVNVTNNIISGNIGGISPDITIDAAAATNFTVSHSIISDTASEPDLPAATPANGNIYNVALPALNLGAAATNGATPVGAAGNQATALSLLPGSGSPALDAAGVGTATVDQRGLPRSVPATSGGPLRSDIGAVEVAAAAAARPQVVPGVTGWLTGLMAAILGLIGAGATRRRK